MINDKSQRGVKKNNQGMVASVNETEASRDLNKKKSIFSDLPKNRLGKVFFLLINTSSREGWEHAS